MEEKKDLKRLLIHLGVGFAAGLVLIAGFVWLMDPFYHYHRPLFDIPVVLENAVYQTAGAARNLEYDSAVVGTSMTENIHTSWFDEAFDWKTMKLSYSGARSDDLKAIFEQMNLHEGPLKHVVMDLNDYQLSCESWTSYVERPEYLYDENPWNDYQYLLSRDVLLKSVRRGLDGLTKEKDNIDLAYTWEEDTLFCKEMALDSASVVRGQLIWERYQQFGEEGLYATTGNLSENYGIKLQNCKENLENIIPFIEKHPETKFYIMLPAYSMLYWEEKVLTGELEDTIALYEYAVGTLLQHENVKVYYFQKEEEIITNLDNYRDSTHHKPEYNHYMFECIRDDKNLLTVENYKEKLGEMYEFARDFSYAKLWN